MIKVDLKGTVKEFEAGVSAAEVAKSIGMGLYKSASVSYTHLTLPTKLEV